MQLWVLERREREEKREVYAESTLPFYFLSTLFSILSLKQGSKASHLLHISPICSAFPLWTFTLVTVYFAIGSLFSLNGCREYYNRINGDKVDSSRLDAERSSYIAPTYRESAIISNIGKYSGPLDNHYARQKAGICVYVFQVIFQINAGAVMLTDSIFWLIIVPFLAIKDYNLSFFMVGMHSINAIFLFGETALNCLRFPWFRVAYFILWTSIFVVFQWVIHACIPIWWPYPFLELKSSYAPVWYLSVGFMHIPCYGIFLLMVRFKHYLLSRWFPLSYQCRR